MKWLNRILYGYFHFNKQERNGVFIFSLVILLLLVLRWGLPRFWPAPADAIAVHIDLDRFAADTARPVKRQAYRRKAKAYAARADARFVFDPNTLSYDNALKLGFTSRQATTLTNFRNKGGVFRKPEDLKKLYGISERFYDDLERYILIPALSKPGRDSLAAGYAARKMPLTRGKELLELNGADSLSLLALRGIGPALAKRILKYRRMLGGFYSVGQLREVYGISDSLATQLAGQVRVDAALLSKLPVNTIEFNQLRRHPYLSVQATQAIINFRTKHGKLNQALFEGIGALNREQLLKIIPYLSFDE